MLHMLRNAGWCIATTYRKTETTKTVYTKIKLQDCKDHYYVVTMSSKQSLRKECIPSGNMGTVTYNMNKDDSDVDSNTDITEVCYLLEVSWQMCHAWVTHGTVERAILTMSRRRSTRDERTHGRDAREPLLARM